MAGIDLVYRVRDFLQAEGYDVSTKRLDALTGKEGNVLRHIQFARTAEYYDGTVEGDVVFQLICRSHEEMKAAQDCCDMAEDIEGMTVTTNNGSFVMDSGGIEIYTEPQELRLDEANMYAWEARFKAHIEKG